MEPKLISLYTPLLVALQHGKVLIREVNAYLNSLQRLSPKTLKVIYGLKEGVGGNFTQARTEYLLRQFLAVQDKPELPSEARLSSALQDDIKATLETIDFNKPGATRAEWQQTIAKKARPIVRRVMP